MNGLAFPNPSHQLFLVIFFSLTFYQDQGIKPMVGLAGLDGGRAGGREDRWHTNNLNWSVGQTRGHKHMAGGGRCLGLG